MRQLKYLNVILTVNACLLTGMLWTQISGGASLASSASAQTTPGLGVPNAADQRQRMIEALHQVKDSVEATRKTIESGKIKVEVTNIDKLIKPESKQP